MSFQRRGRFPAAVTLVEAMVAIAMLAIASVGSLSFQYHVAHHSRVATAQLAATRTAQLLLEDWKSTGASEKYKPSNLGLGFSSALSIPSDFSVSGSLGSALNKAIYAITIDGLPMLVMLQSKDIGYDTVAGTVLRQLSVIVKFGAPSSNDANKDANLSQMGNLLDESLKAIPAITLSTYARIDGAGG